MAQPGLLQSLPDDDAMSPNSPSSELPPREAGLAHNVQISAAKDLDDDFQEDNNDFIDNDYGEELAESKSKGKIELTSDKPKSSFRSFKQTKSVRSLNSQKMAAESKQSPPIQTQDEPFHGSGQSSP